MVFITLTEQSVTTCSLINTHAILPRPEKRFSTPSGSVSGLHCYPTPLPCSSCCSPSVIHSPDKPRVAFSPPKQMLQTGTVVILPALKPGEDKHVTKRLCK
ncbi:hypothetical protein I79_020828 [Cricetulus griseus]|uniref:Uncharacterized protein n=1 Tax=Cricetulus griseus TaxID=10029 RepID=G3IB41_CRIGR|nr:hypothetical protein I79_020828 [Cricetulus griseus]